jgi:hypothetical protein
VEQSFHYSKLNSLISFTHYLTYRERLFLNHQHSTEYLLLLSDGKVYARLHRNFEEKLKPLLQKWADSKRKPLQLTFRWSCDCSEESQRKADAGYYNLRGMYHMKRGQPELAYGYLREAHKQDPGDLGIRNRYLKTLNEFRAFLKDPKLEQYLEDNDQGVGQEMPFTVSGSSTARERFLHDYVWMLSRPGGLGSITCGSDSVDDRSSTEGGQDEWSCLSYEPAVEPGLIEVESNLLHPSYLFPELPESAMEIARAQYFIVPQ